MEPGGPATRLPVGVVLGTRPEVVKLAPVVAALRRSPTLRPVVISTGQQLDLLPGALAELGVEVDVTLPVRRTEHLADRVAAMLQATADLLATLELAAVVVQGDTATSLAAAQAAFYRRVPVVHVEAGLRTGSPREPFPEEANRRMIAVLAALHLAPTEDARANLLAEGHDPTTVRVTGNTVVDALLGRASGPLADPRLARVVAGDRKVVVLTMHRRESWGEPMRAVAEVVAKVLERRGDSTVVVPAHPNPVVLEALAPLVASPHALVVEPLPHGPFLRLLAAATVVLTDSGGVQEEAPTLGVPVLVLRAVTERPEGVRSGAATVVGTDPGEVAAALEAALDRPRRTTGPNPYGDGHAAQRCVDAIAGLLGVADPQPSRASSAGATTLR
ncbi:UDP-N-acetylglucosamine 2-epimerase (non-hydrolyzing) [Microlunatus spumicola]|uniref:UDP-N-acetylglucosamine 2-epimerase (non-hydrolyzing) n=1 Tax=Microlunatus spumicola TaxID=81499 RepID=A0ABP6X5U4_9ACTN